MFSYNPRSEYFFDNWVIRAQSFHDNLKIKIAEKISPLITPWAEPILKFFNIKFINSNKKCCYNNTFEGSFKWQINYFLLNLGTKGFQFLASLNPYLSNRTSDLLAAGIYTAAIQGNRDCDAQKYIFTDYRLLSYLAGFINGITGSKIDNYISIITTFILTSIGAPVAVISCGQAASFILNSYLSSTYMCLIEQGLYYYAFKGEKYFSEDTKKIIDIDRKTSFSNKIKQNFDEKYISWMLL